jgi:serine/threonine protein kinase
LFIGKISKSEKQESILILFRDLKLEHAIVCSGGHIRLVDYGLGRLFKTPDEVCHTFCGTYTYMAPEVNFSKMKKNDKHRIVVYLNRSDV